MTCYAQWKSKVSKRTVEIADNGTENQTNCYAVLLIPVELNSSIKYAVTIE